MDMLQELKDLPMLILKESIDYMILSFKIFMIPFTLAMLIHLSRFVLD